MLRRLLAALASALAASCGMSESREESVAIADRYFAAISTGDVASALGFYSPQFFAATPRADMERILKDLAQRCGKVNSHKLVAWTTTTPFGASASKTVLVYDVQYSNCEVKETMSISKPDGGAAQIVGHRINAQPTDSGHASKPAQSI